jgi:hypothetical protein
MKSRSKIKRKGVKKMIMMISVIKERMIRRELEWQWLNLKKLSSAQGMEHFC